MSFIALHFNSSLLIFSLVVIWTPLNLSEYYSTLEFHYTRLDIINYWILLIILSITTLACIASGSCRNESLLIRIFLLNLFICIIILKVSHLVVFYILFELAALPILIIILGWGNQPEKVSASLYIFLYTVISSAPIISSFIFIILNSPGTSLLIFNLTQTVQRNSCFILISVLTSLGIIVKLPIFLVHNWLPKAHVEAPVFGSIILAGILLKLGAVALIRMNCYTFNIKVLRVFASISFIGLLAVSILVLAKTDIKQIVAYSSILHMAFPVVIFELSTSTRTITFVLALITHAFSSSGIFYIVFCFYSKVGSRRTILIKGSSLSSPRMIFFWLLIVVARLGGPPTVNLLVELIVILLSFHSFGAIIILILIPCVAICAFHLIIYASPTQNTPEVLNFCEQQSFCSNSNLICLSHSILVVACLLIVPVLLSL